jgi:hypothetical protein
VTVPTVHVFDDKDNVIVMDDCGEAITLKQFFLDGRCSVATGKRIGVALGEFIGRLHGWGQSDPAVLQIFAKNEQAKQISAWATYGRLISTLTGQDSLEALQDPPLSPSDSDLSIIKEVVAHATNDMMTATDTVSDRLVLLFGAHLNHSCSS